MFKRYSGFTFIEILIVIAIVAILGSLVMVSFTASQKRARDANRKSDLAQYRNALEAYANKNNGLYYSHSTSVAADTICGATELNLGITCPVDPKNGTSPYGYRFVSDGTTGSISATKYLLYAYLEASLNYWGMCSTGTIITKATAPSLADCP